MTDPAAAERGRYGRRRPRPGLNVAVIAAAGRRLVEREGVEALTMRAVAAELGSAAPSLYRHVADREALLMAILEDIAADLPVEVPGRGPQERLSRRLLDFRAYMRDYVWVLHILVAGELVAVNALPFAEACIADFRAAGLPLDEAAAAYRVSYRFVLGDLLDSAPLRAPSRPSQRERVLAEADPERFPNLAALAPGSTGADDPFPTALAGLVRTLCAG